MSQKVFMQTLHWTRFFPVVGLTKVVPRSSGMEWWWWPLYPRFPLPGCPPSESIELRRLLVSLLVSSYIDSFSPVVFSCCLLRLSAMLPLLFPSLLLLFTSLLRLLFSLC